MKHQVENFVVPPKIFISKSVNWEMLKPKMAIVIKISSPSSDYIIKYKFKVFVVAMTISHVNPKYHKIIPTYSWGKWSLRLYNCQLMR